MRRRTAALLAMTAAASAGLWIGAVGLREARGASDAPAASEVTMRRSDVSRARWLLGGYGGKLALYRALKEEPEIVFNVWLHSLPDVDRERLAAGIEIDDEEQLLALIEDYTS